VVKFAVAQNIRLPAYTLLAKRCMYRVGRSVWRVLFCLFDHRFETCVVEIVGRGPNHYPRLTTRSHFASPHSARQYIVAGKSRWTLVTPTPAVASAAVIEKSSL
jgi:hypothetical protein